MKILNNNTIYESIDPRNNPNFNRWFGNSKIVHSDGTPMIVYHGTTNDFSSFNMSYAREGNMGRGFYFTNDVHDAGGNYGCELGADAKIHREEYVDVTTSDISYNLSKLSIDDLSTTEISSIYTKDEINEIKGIMSNLDEYNSSDFDDISTKIAERIFDEKYRKNCGNIMPCYIKMENPFITTGEFGEYEYEYNDPDDLDSGIEPSGKTLELFNALSDFGIDFSFYEYSPGDVIENSKILELIDKNESLLDEYGYGEAAKRIITRLGYDGIIDPTVSIKFKNMGLDEDTVHYIVYDPLQIKSIYNKGSFNPNTMDITLEDIG